MPHARNCMPLAAVLLVLTACANKEESSASPASGESAAAAKSDPIASAESAAPKAIASAATIVVPGADGSMSELRKGTNGWTCMPDNPTTPGPDPMCMDGNAMAWAMAWMGRTTPPANQPGVMYMLSGGTDASNTDPYATQPTTGGDWVKTGPHLMVVGSEAVLKGYPSGQQPNTAAPYVMWEGTPYAHLMVPTN